MPKKFTVRKGKAYYRYYQSREGKPNRSFFRGDPPDEGGNLIRNEPSDCVTDCPDPEHPAATTSSGHATTDALSTTSYPPINQSTDVHSLASEGSTAANPARAVSNSASNLVSYFSFMNIQGLAPQTKQSKVAFIQDTIVPTNQIFMGLSETWLNNHKEAELNIDGYTTIRCDSSRKKKSNRGRYTGGVSFYVRDDIAISSEVLVKHSSDSVQLLCLYSKSENIAIACLY